MAYAETTWYANAGDQVTTGYYAIAKRPQNAAVAAGQIVRQFTAPTVGNERAFICIIAGTTANTTDATWTLTRGVKVTDGTATWQECTGQAALNGDSTNVHTWATFKTATGVPSLGVIIKRNNGASYQICTTAGTCGASEPSFSDTAGTTTTDNTATWTSLGAVSGFASTRTPFARLASACATTWFAVNNTLFVASNHAESQATAIAIAPAGSMTTIAKIICHNVSGSYPPASDDLTTGATVSTTGAVAITPISTANAVAYVKGITYRAGVGASGAAAINTSGTNMYTRYDDCSFQIATTNNTSGSYIQFGSSTYNTIYWNNCTVKFAAAAQGLFVYACNLVWRNTGPILDPGSVVPVTLITGVTNETNMVTMEALDLSQITGNITNNATGSSAWMIQDCKLNAAALITTPTGPGIAIQLARSSS